MTVTAPRPSIASTTRQADKTPRGRHRISRRKQWLASHPAWPLVALLAGYPVWWAFGLADESTFIMAVPMLMQMRSWHRRGRPVNVPPAFGLWLLFLVCVAAGIATLGLSAPDTVVSLLSNRVLSFVDRGVTYGGLTVILLYAGNLNEDELPRRRLAWLLGLVGIYTTIGGVGGVADPAFPVQFPAGLCAASQHAVEHPGPGRPSSEFLAGHQRAGGDRGTSEGALRVHQHLG